MKAGLLWPEWLEHIWAKSPAPGQPKGESLAQHTLGALSRLMDMLRLRPGLGASRGFPGLPRCMFWACFLHDWGKSARGFQASLRGGPRWGHRHEIVSLVFLDWIAAGLSEDEKRWVAAAIASHHRDRGEIQLLYPVVEDPEDDPLRIPVSELDAETLLGLHRWLVGCLPSWVEYLDATGLEVDVSGVPGARAAVESVGRAGLGRARWWLGEYRRLARDLERRVADRLVVAAMALRGHMTTCDYTASAHTGQLPAPLLGRGDIHRMLGLTREGMYAHQEESLGTEGSAILVAPTGSGKTEAALLWAHAQAVWGADGAGHRSAPVRPRLFYMLPYQASMNAMYDRLQSSFPDQVGLEHSRSALALYRALLDQDEPPRAAARMARWERNLAQLHYYPVRVLSPYQMIKAPFRLKGYEALLTDFLDASCVLDEIHAYEPARLALILATVRYLAEHYGTRFFVMSATLPGLVVTRVKEALDDCETLRATPELFARFRRHRLHLEEGDLLENGLPGVEQAAREGHSVLACCNTVKRAQAAYESLRDRLAGLAPVVLLHGRFNGRDRLDKERVVRRCAGARSGERRPVVLVATQVVEVSLDIDLDLLYTDPAPLEALIQRFGRINRRCTRGFAPVHVFVLPDDGQHVYDAGLVRAALRVLKDKDGEVIDEEAISEWLDQVYVGDIAASWEKEYAASHEQFVRGPLAALRPFESDDTLEEQFYQAFDGVEVLPAGLEPEFRRLMDEDPLRATELLVPMSFGQFARLQSRGKVVDRRDRPKGWPRVVGAEYSSEHGLRVTS
ncbi:MAG: CRISPR-associated helicase Cas3' [Bacillota bacterium]